MSAVRSKRLAVGEVECVTKISEHYKIHEFTEFGSITTIAEFDS